MQISFELNEHPSNGRLVQITQLFIDSVLTKYDITNITFPILALTFVNFIEAQCYAEEGFIFIPIENVEIVINALTGRDKKVNWIKDGF